MPFRIEPSPLTIAQVMPLRKTGLTPINFWGTFVRSAKARLMMPCGGVSTRALCGAMFAKKIPRPD